MIVMSHCEPTLSRFSILMLNNVVERTSRCFWISHHVPESAVAVLAAKKSAPLELRNDFLRERIEVYGHDRETDHETVTSTVPVPVLHLVSDIRSRPREDRQAEAGNQSLIGLADSYCVRSEEHTSELQSLMRISYAVFCLKKKNKKRSQQ